MADAEMQQDEFRKPISDLSPHSQIIKTGIGRLSLAFSQDSRSQPLLRSKRLASDSWDTCSKRAAPDPVITWEPRIGKG